MCSSVLALLYFLWKNKKAHSVLPIKEQMIKSLSLSLNGDIEGWRDVVKESWWVGWLSDCIIDMYVHTRGKCSFARWRQLIVTIVRISILIRNIQAKKERLDWFELKCVINIAWIIEWDELFCSSLMEIRAFYEPREQEMSRRSWNTFVNQLISIPVMLYVWYCSCFCHRRLIDSYAFRMD